MAWVRAKKDDIEIFVRLYSSRNNVYKTTKYYIDGERVTFRKKEIREIFKDAPEDVIKVLKANTWFWEPFWGNSDQRERYARKLLLPLANFLIEKGFEVETSWD